MDPNAQKQSLSDSGAQKRSEANKVRADKFTGQRGGVSNPSPTTSPPQEVERKQDDKGTDSIDGTTGTHGSIAGIAGTFDDTGPGTLRYAGSQPDYRTTGDMTNTSIIPSSTSPHDANTPHTSYGMTDISPDPTIEPLRRPYVRLM